MNGYVCFYKDKRIEVHAHSTYAAQTEAARVLKVSAKQQYQISVTLAEKNGEPVVHPTAGLF